MQQLATSQASPEVLINDNFATLAALATFGKNPVLATGLTWAYLGGIWGGNVIADGTLALTNAATNYVVVDRATGIASVSTTTTNWLNTPQYARAHVLTTAGSVITAIADNRAGLYGTHGMQLPERRQVVMSAAYTFVLADMHASYLHPSADTTARPWTIPANASVAYPVNAELEIFNQNAAGVLTIAITTDTMRLSGAGTTGSRTLAANGWARARKITSTEWLITNLGGLT